MKLVILMALIAVFWFEQKAGASANVVEISISAGSLQR